MAPVHSLHPNGGNSLLPPHLPGQHTPADWNYKTIATCGSKSKEKTGQCDKMSQDLQASCLISDGLR